MDDDKQAERNNKFSRYMSRFLMKSWNLYVMANEWIDKQNNKFR